MYNTTPVFELKTGVTSGPLPGFKEKNLMKSEKVHLHLGLGNALYYRRCHILARLVTFWLVFSWFWGKNYVDFLSL